MMVSEFNIVFWVILSVFTLGAASLATIAVANVIRLRNVRLSWKDGKMLGYPLFSTLFMASAAFVGAVAFYAGEMQEMLAAGMYGWLSVCWFTTSYLSTKRFITDNGIVKNVNEPSQTVAWHQIRDFVEKKGDTSNTYIFIYSQAPCQEPQNLIRLEIEVPSNKIESFQKLISHKLGRRIRCYMKDDADDINVEQFR